MKEASMVNELNLLKLLVTLKADSSPARPHGFSRTIIMWLLIRKNGLRALRNIIIHFRTLRTVLQLFVHFRSYSKSYGLHSSY
ncbi:hypothetical protein [Paenibacillus odorifer]|uniref:hypothetical protein n=2 Tax=Paenibacillus TaxID=44249 RepID=UPI002DB9015B|nr:hypothetical protein [Paenibacillus odorifer]MEC0133381.1 hypothetical protein [Paenibacillus odorifer]